MFTSAMGRAIARSTAILLMLGAGGMVALPAAPASAQSAVGAVCMQGHVRNVGLVAERDRGKPFVVLVTEPAVDDFKSLGLTVTQCSAELATSAGQAAERDAICAMAYSGNEAVQAQLHKVFGVHPGLLCRAAEQVAGPWSGEKIDLSQDDLEARAPPSG